MTGYRSNIEYEIYTSNGFQDFKGIKQSQRPDNIRLRFTDGSTIVTTPEHRLKVSNNIFRRVSKLKIGNKVQSKKIENIDHNVECSNLFYDLIEVQGGNHYTSSGVESHNCAYIANNDIKDFEDSVLPTVESVPNSQIFKSSTAKGRNHWYFEVKRAKNNKKEYEAKDHIQELDMIAEEAYASILNNNKYSIIKEKSKYIYSAKVGKSGYAIVEANYLDRFPDNPAEAEAFKQRIIAEKDIVFFQQAHANEFLGSSYTLINDKILANIETKEDDEIIFDSIFEGLRVYHEPIAGNHYIVTADPKKDGIDSVGIQVIDVTYMPFIQVATAEIMDSYLVVPGKLFDLGNYYNQAMVVCENNVAESIPSTLFYNYEYEGEVFVEKRPNGKLKNEMGFRTTQKTKRLGLTLLKKFVEAGNIIINDKKTLDQLFNFIEHKNGSFSAGDNGHDDLVMALMLVFAPFLDFKNFDNFKGFVAYLEKSKEHKAQEEQEASEFLDLGFVDFNDEDELPFTKGLWDFQDNFEH